jgi:hypothetical protein
MDTVINEESIIVENTPADSETTSTPTISVHKNVLPDDIIANYTTIPKGCYSEAGSGGTAGYWSDTNALSTLSGVLSSTTVGVTWVTLGTNTPYELVNMGYSPYSLNNINLNTTPISLNNEFTISVNQGSNGASPVIPNGSTYSILQY